MSEQLPQEPSQELSVIHPTDEEARIVPKEGGNIAVTALEPDHMQQSQAALIEWAERKVAEVDSDAKELRAAADHAKAHRWSWKTLAAHASKAEKRIVFYQKVLAALKAGYCIVPNFPVTLFAIRTDRNKPERNYVITKHYWSVNGDKPLHADLLPEGEGEYKFARAENTVEKYGDGPDVIYHSWASDWKEMEFPINMAKPSIMQAATNAMALKIFDDLGVLPSPYKKADPVIVGRLIDPRGNRHITFMVAWHLDTRVL